MKPNKVIWSNEVQQKLSRRKLVIINRIDEPKWVSKNKTIMDMVVEYVKKTKDNSKVISILNQVRIHKKMILLYELVRFSGRRKTREAREEKEISSL